MTRFRSQGDLFGACCSGPSSWGWLPGKRPIQSTGGAWLVTSSCRCRTAQQFGPAGRVFLVDLHGKSMVNHGKSMENHGKSMECNNNQRVTPFILNAVGLSDNDPKSEFPQPRTTSILFSNAVALLTSHTALRLYTAALKLGAQFFSIAGCSMQLAFTKALDQRRGQGQTLPFTLRNLPR